MDQLNFFVLCILIAAPRSTECSATGATFGASFSFAAPREMNPRLGDDQDFVHVKMATPYIEFVTEKYQFLTRTFDECRSEAITAGVQAFQVIADDDTCVLVNFYHPVCKKFEGQLDLYIRKDYFSDGSQRDNAWKSQAHIELLYGENSNAFRIDSPTIFSFQEHFRTQGEITRSDSRVFSSNGWPRFFDRSIRVDPNCFTNSSCGYVFVTYSPKISADEHLVLYDICGQKIQLDSGKSFYVMSHDLIGCRLFPNDYPVTDCWAEFTGTGEIKFNVTFVNLRDSNQCDGFTMTVMTYDANGSSNNADLCAATAPTELTSAGGRVRIEFSGGAGGTHQKYGFIIQVTSG